MGAFIDKLIYSAGASSYITVSSDKSVIIEGCKQIIECTEILVRIRSIEFEIDIWGSELVLTSFANGSVEIKGCIRSISLERRRKRGVI